MSNAVASVQARLDGLTGPRLERAVPIVDTLLDEARRLGASDVHFEPTPRSVEVRFRLDGVLQPIATLDAPLAPNLVARLKVLAELLTYRTDVPQEGSIRRGTNGKEMRVSTFPTIHGEKVVVRLFEGNGKALELDQLGFAPDMFAELTALLHERTGTIFFTGPSGSGKTTTIYACLRHLLRSGPGRNIVTIEDPVEQVIAGVSQSQVRPGTEFDFARGLRSLMRQDPEVIVIGEVRDRETAGIAIEAGLTGHLVITTLHAGSTCGVITRLVDMGVEPYLLTSSVRGIINQRLVRRRCPNCVSARGDGGEESVRSCSHCSGTGYRGRLLLAELLTLDESLRHAVLARADTARLEAAACPGRQTIEHAAAHAIAKGLTTSDEIARVLGPRATIQS